ncbi:MAG TPA: cupin domain-containing protein [Syntrophomonas sp.]|nr:cupin domain-containing protein [Syntrophomonas sp.]
MEVIKASTRPFMKTGWGVKGKPLVDLPDLGITNLLLEPGEKVPSHKTPVDVVFQVLEGQGTITIGQDSQLVEAGDLVISPAQIPHELEANQGCLFSVYVMKVPNTKKTAIKE